MTLSMNKLETFMSKHGMTSKNFFVDDRYKCIYIEVFEIKYMESFMLYIPSKYDIVIEKGINVHLITKCPVDDRGDLIDQYVDISHINHVESMYDEINISNTLDRKCNIEKHLEEKYNRPVVLSSRIDSSKCKDVYRQLRRLGLCMQSTKYKICIISKNMMYCLKKDNTIELHVIDFGSERKMKHRRLMITIDLELLYEKIKGVSDDVNEIKSRLLAILSKTFIQHIDTVVENIKNVDVIERNKLDVIDKDREYVNRSKDVNQMLNNLFVNEKELLDKRNDVENELGNKQSHGVNRDMERLKKMRPYDIKLSDINENKKELIRNIISLKNKRDNMLLNADSISFDLLVMVESINQKIANVSEI